eukprot:15327653-Ditylum_brightwellii.AAC.1
MGGHHGPLKFDASGLILDVKKLAMGKAKVTKPFEENIAKLEEELTRSLLDDGDDASRASKRSVVSLRMDVDGGCEVVSLASDLAGSYSEEDDHLDIDSLLHISKAVSTLSASSDEDESNRADIKEEERSS